MKNLKRLTALAGACMALASQAHAADIVALTTVNAVGNQPWTGALGMDFTVNSAITVTQLGTYDSGANGITGSISVGVFDTTSGLQVGPTATFTGFAGALVGLTVALVGVLRDFLGFLGTD